MYYHLLISGFSSTFDSIRGGDYHRGCKMVDLDLTLLLKPARLPAGLEELTKDTPASRRANARQPPPVRRW